MGASAFGSISALAATPPSPSSVEPSFLYADLQSRSLWLGVDPAVNPLGSVLIADIVQTQADIIAAEVNAKLYTDAQIPTRAPLVHTHLAADISDFGAAVDAAVSDNVDIQWIPGTLMMWGGLISAIGVGQLAGWALCNGQSLLRTSYPALFANIGTIHGAQDSEHFSLPDLRDRFIIGGGNLLPGQKNPLTVATSNFTGTHDHTISGHALTEAQLGSHAHVTGPYRAYGATYGGAGNHAHSIYGPMWTGSWLQHDASGEGDLGVNNGGFTHGSAAAGAHDHSCFVDIHVATDYRGGNATHTHGCQTNGGHEHTITTSQIRDASPYFALAFIMKL